MSAMSELEAEACREALRWRAKYEELWDAIDEYLLWEPGRKGHAAALKRLVAVYRGEEVDE